MRTFVFLGRPVTLNEYINAERRNRFLGAKLKKQETETIAWELRNEKPIEGKIDIEYTFYADSQRIDPDNYTNFFEKTFLDGLQKAGVIENDNQKTIGRRIKNALLIDSKNPRVVVKITKHES